MATVNDSLVAFDAVQIAEQFKQGQSIRDLADSYDITTASVESIIRLALGARVMSEEE
jgi:hypothetical protein